MIVGIGTDIVEISRFSSAKQSFIQKIFTDAEINYIYQRKMESMAGIFAAKEAVIKCFGSNLKKISMRDIEILHGEKNAPMVKLYNGAFEIATHLKITDIKISISHEKKYAIAFVIAENKSWK